MTTTAEAREASTGLDSTLDPRRHLLIFDPHHFGDRRVDVIGCGAVGSRIAMEVAKLGVQNLHLWDFDTIEAHNIANQLFNLDDIGKPKATTLATHVRQATGLEPAVHQKRVSSRQAFGDVVFLAVDTMADRKSIFEHSLRLTFTTQLVVEVRMGAEELRVYGFNPRTRRDCQMWTESLSDDEATVESACGAQTTVGATAGITACLAVHRFLQWYRQDVVRDPTHTAELPIEQVMMLRPIITFTN
jgi:molybdopterin/thiamine biosynthesis adenylyltransferase